MNTSPAERSAIPYKLIRAYKGSRQAGTMRKFNQRNWSFGLEHTLYSDPGGNEVHKLCRKLFKLLELVNVLGL